MEFFREGFFWFLFFFFFEPTTNLRLSETPAFYLITVTSGGQERDIAGPN